MCKEHCGCRKIAVWCYMPGFANGGSPYFCDECVHRGCSCNHRYIDGPDLPEGEEGKDWIWIEDGVWTNVDENGKEFPCAEYDYDPDGYERELNPHKLN